MFLKARARPLIGLDITTSSIKLIEISLKGSQYCVEAYAAEATPANAMNEKAVTDPVLVAEAIQRAAKRAGTKTKDVAIAISGDAAITKVIQMPDSLSANDLEDQIELQADQFIPFPMDEVRYDYEVIGQSEKKVGMVDVLLVASRSENVAQRVLACEMAGLHVRVVDVEPYALENSCRLMMHQLPNGGVDRVIAVADFGASSTTFSVMKNLSVIYTRDLAFGGNQLTEDIMRTYGLSYADAGRSKKLGGLPDNYQSDVLNPFINDMCQQIIRSLQFFNAAGISREQPEFILISGGCANIPGVAQYISNRLGIRAECCDPLGRVKVNSRAESQRVRKDATALLTACGLALRSVD